MMHGFHYFSYKEAWDFVFWVFLFLGVFAYCSNDKIVACRRCFFWVHSCSFRDCSFLVHVYTCRGCFWLHPRVFGVWGERGRGPRCWVIT